MRADRKVVRFIVPDVAEQSAGATPFLEIGGQASVHPAGRRQTLYFHAYLISFHRSFALSHIVSPGCAMEDCTEKRYGTSQDNALCCLTCFLRVPDRQLEVERASVTRSTVSGPACALVALARQGRGQCRSGATGGVASPAPTRGRNGPRETPRGVVRNPLAVQIVRF